MKWTEKQAEAINKRNKNLLVAAAAGSGKTAVLVERIKQLILKDGCPIDRMLVVTFTNAAASEMKGKIEKAIREEISRLSTDDSREVGSISRSANTEKILAVKTLTSVPDVLCDA